MTFISCLHIYFISGCQDSIVFSVSVVNSQSEPTSLCGCRLVSSAMRIAQGEISKEPESCAMIARAACGHGDCI
jgi:hypothetical protein